MTEPAGEERVRAMQDHYDRFLAGHYLWMSGGFERNAEKNRIFFATHGIVPRDTRVAIDLGAGPGFQAVPLAGAGFMVHAVDLCRPLLDKLADRSHGLPITVHAGDILDFSLWGGLLPELIVCMGDTLTHLGSLHAAGELVTRCHAELRPGGRCIFSFRDYPAALVGEVEVIPVQRDPDQIFLCRLGYGKENVEGTDILYARSAGRWSRSSSGYTKIRIGSYVLRKILSDAGFRIAYCSTGNGLITIIAEKRS
jgi:SAM-dependent methyltransferase